MIECLCGNLIVIKCSHCALSVKYKSTNFIILKTNFFFQTCTFEFNKEDVKKRFCLKLHGKLLLGLPKNPRDWCCCHITGYSFVLQNIVKANHIEVDVVFVNMFLQNMVAIAALKKNQLLLKLFLNLVHVQTTVNFLHKWKLLIWPRS